MAKFKVGDEVIIQDGSKIPRYYGGWVDGMMYYVGKKAKITRVFEFPWGTGYMLEGADIFKYDERGLKPAKADKIIIMADKKDPRKVIAKDLATGKTACAKCSPDDKFDFGYGARLALDRLTVKPEPKQPKPKFKVGDWVVGTEESSKHYCITKKGWVGNVIDYDSTDNTILVRGLDSGGVKEADFWVKSNYFMPSTNLNMDVVCVDDDGISFMWTVGKLYRVRDGYIKANTGNNIGQVKNLEGLNSLLRPTFAMFID